MAGGFRINQESTTLSALGLRLEEIFKTRNERVMFVRGGPDVNFSDVAAVIDIAKAAGTDKVGLITKAMEEGS
jgi:biopolymer transport protein ExbD